MNFALNAARAIGPNIQGFGEITDSLENLDWGGEQVQQRALHDLYAR